MSRFDLPKIPLTQSPVKDQNDTRYASFTALRELQDAQERFAFLESLNKDATREEIAECARLAERIEQMEENVSGESLWNEIDDAVPTVELANVGNYYRDGIKIVQNGLVLSREVTMDYDVDKVVYRALTPGEARRVLQESETKDTAAREVIDRRTQAGIAMLKTLVAYKRENHTDAPNEENSEVLETLRQLSDPQAIERTKRRLAGLERMEDARTDAEEKEYWALQEAVENLPDITDEHAMKTLFEYHPYTRRIPALSVLRVYGCGDDEVKIMPDGSILYKKVEDDDGYKKAEFRFLTPAEAQKLVEESLKIDQKVHAVVQSRITGVRGAMQKIFERDGSVPVEVPVDDRSIQEKERSEEREKINAIWNALIENSEVPDAFFHGDLENMLQAVSAMRTEHGKPTKAVNDVLFTVRNLLHEDQSVRALGALRIARKEFVTNILPKTFPGTRGGAQRMADSMFQSFDRAFLNFVRSGTFKGYDDDGYIRGLLEKYISGNGAELIDEEQDPVYLSAATAAIRSLQFFGIFPEELLRTRTISEAEDRRCIAVDLAGALDEDLWEKIQKAPMFEQERDFVVGDAGGKEILSISTDGPRPSIVPDLVAIQRAIAGAGMMNPAVQKASTIVEAIFHSGGILTYGGEYGRDPEWQFAYKNEYRDWSYGNI